MAFSGGRVGVVLQVGGGAAAVGAGGAGEAAGGGAGALGGCRHTEIVTH